MSILFKLGWFFRQERRRYAIAFSALLAIAGLIMLPPWITGQVVDAISEDRLTQTQLLQYVGLLVGVGVLVYGLRILWRRQLYGASFKLASILRCRIYQHLTLMPPGFYQNHSTGDLMARATNDVTAVEMTAGEAILALVDGVLTGIIVLIVMMVMVSWKLTLLALLPWPIMTYFMWKYGREMHDAFGHAQKQFSRLNDSTQESLTAIRLIKAFGQEKHRQDEYARITADVSNANMEVAKVDSKYDPTIFTTVGSSFLFAVGGGAWWIHQGELTIGQLTTFTMYLGFLIWPMFAYGWTLNLLERGAAAHKRIDALLQTQPDVQDNGDIETINRNQNSSEALRIKIHRFHYPTLQQTILDDVDFTLRQGDTLGIVGRTGSGKTTLIKLILRLYDCTDGTLQLHEHPLNRYRLSCLREQFGLVPQEPFLFSTSIAENIALGSPEATQQAIEEAARIACIDDDIRAFPEGYQTQVGERGITLSGGQKQRIAIARALLLDPPILILDDALSAVDVETEKRILKHLREARQSRSNIIICHRLSAVIDAQEILVLDHGKISERGDHQTLLRHQGWYAQMYRYQQIEAAIEQEE